MSNLEMKVNALMRLVASEDGPGYDAAKAEILRLMNVSAAPAELDVEEEITKVLLDIGMPQHVLGFRYNVEAIRLAVEDKSIINEITCRLYPEVAKVCNTTASRVERAIRHGVEIAWDRGGLDTLAKYFGNTISATKGKPTNSEFIARIADHIRRRMKRSKAVG